jgi:hypothetical protein
MDGFGGSPLSDALRSDTRSAARAREHNFAREEHGRVESDHIESVPAALAFETSLQQSVKLLCSRGDSEYAARRCGPFPSHGEIDELELSCWHTECSFLTSLGADEALPSSDTRVASLKLKEREREEKKVKCTALLTWKATPARRREHGDRARSDDTARSRPDQRDRLSPLEHLENGKRKRKEEYGMKRRVGGAGDVDGRAVGGRRALLLLAQRPGVAELAAGCREAVQAE